MFGKKKIDNLTMTDRAVKSVTDCESLGKAHNFGAPTRTYGVMGMGISADDLYEADEIVDEQGEMVDAMEADGLSYYDEQKCKECGKVRIILPL